MALHRQLEGRPLAAYNIDLTIKRLSSSNINFKYNCIMEYHISIFAMNVYFLLSLVTFLILNKSVSSVGLYWFD